MIPKERLASFPVFTNLPEEVVSRLSEKMAEEFHSQGDTIFAEGKWGDAIYFIAKGQVIIRKTINKEQGSFKVIALMGLGEFFGEMALLENTRRSAEAIAQNDVTLYRLAKEEFEALLEGDPKSALQLFKGIITTISGRLRQTTREMVAVFEVGRTLVQELNTQTLASRILTLVHNSFEEGEIVGAFFYWNEFTSEYELMASEGGWPEALRGNRTKEDLLFRIMAIKKECVISPNFQEDSRFPEAIKNQWKGALSFLAAPIFGMKGPVGHIIFIHQNKQNIFRSGHRQVLAGVSNLVAPAFENAAWRQEMESKRRLERSKTVAY